MWLPVNCVLEDNVSVDSDSLAQRHDKQDELKREKLWKCDLGLIVFDVLQYFKYTTQNKFGLRYAYPPVSFFGGRGRRAVTLAVDYHLIKLKCMCSYCLPFVQHWNFVAVLLVHHDSLKEL